MSAAVPSQGRPRKRGEGQARRARPRVWMEADNAVLRIAIGPTEAAANYTPSGGSAAAELANEAASVGGCP